MTAWTWRTETPRPWNQPRRAVADAQGIATGTTNGGNAKPEGNPTNSSKAGHYGLAGERHYVERY